MQPKSKVMIKVKLHATIGNYKNKNIENSNFVGYKIYSCPKVKHK